MMKKISKLISFVFLMGILPAYASDAVVLPQQNGMYTVIETDSDYKDALHRATEKANDVCDDHDGKLVVVNYSDDRASEEDDYKVTLLFRCEKED